MPRGRQSPPRVIGTALISGCPGDAPKKKKEEVEFKLGESKGARLCQPSLFSLLCPSAQGLRVIDSSPIKSEERLTCDLKLSPSQPHPSSSLFHLHANSLFTAYALPPLAMNSGQGPRRRGRLSSANKTRRRGKMQQGDNIGETLGKRSPEAPADALHKDRAFK